MKRFLLCMLCMLCLTVPLLSAAETAPEVVFLPRGAFVQGEDGWRFRVEEAAPLTETLRAVAEKEGIPIADGMLPEGTLLSQDQIEALYPGAEDYFALPPEAVETVAPGQETALEMFELTGEWFYGEDGALYYADKESGATMTMDGVFEALSGQVTGGQRSIYLTIDDTPSPYTMEMLAVLDWMNVKATFFVVGAYVEKLPVFLRAIYEQGHVIANHSHSHSEQTLNSSVEACLRDFRRCEEAVAEALGFALPMPILRIPYGSGALSREHREALQRNGYMWVDWNALNGDTEDNITTDEMALERAFSTAGRYDGDIVILVHDGKKRTIRTLPELIRKFREQGYEFRVLEPGIEKIEGVRMGFPIS